MGLDEYRPLAARYRVPIVVTGFEPLDLLQGIHMCVRQLEEGRAEVENQYARAVRQEGNAAALAVHPRGVRGRRPGTGAASARSRRAAWRCAALRRAATPSGGSASRPSAARESPECRSGQVLQGLLKPTECPAFGTRCTPERPLGATMVSSEGTCAAYYRYRRTRPEAS